jgi:hypothetical protein
MSLISIKNEKFKRNKKNLKNKLFRYTKSKSIRKYIKFLSPQH